MRSLLILTLFGFLVFGCGDDDTADATVDVLLADVTLPDAERDDATLSEDSSLKDDAAAPEDATVEDATPDATPDAEVSCIEELIAGLMSRPDRNPPAQVWSWTLPDGTIYYYINAECCDQFSRLLDENCQRICAPDGGFTGQGDGNCPDTTGKEEVLIYDQSQ